MRASSVMLLAALFVLLGRWAKGQTFDARVIVGGIFAALIISIMDGFDSKLAKGFAWLFFVSAALTYLDPILQGVGAMPKPVYPSQGGPNAVTGGQGNPIIKKVAS